MDVIIYPYRDYSESVLVSGAPGVYGLTQHVNVPHTADVMRIKQNETDAYAYFWK